MRRLCWKPRPTFCSTPSTAIKRVNPSFKTSVIGPSYVCRHPSHILCYPVMFSPSQNLSINRIAAYILTWWLAFNRLSQFFYFIFYMPPVWNEIPKAILQGAEKIDCRNKMLYNWFFFPNWVFFRLLKWWQLSHFCVRHLTFPTHANVLLAAPGGFFSSVQLGNSFLSSGPAVHLI